MPEAEKLAAEYHLPILVGRNEHLAGADIDDSAVAVINVPTDERVEYEQEVREPGSVLCVQYFNDFRRIDSASLVVTSPSGVSVETKAEISERHFSRFVHRPDEAGDHVFRIADNDEVLFVGGFRVGNGRTDNEG